MNDYARADSFLDVQENQVAGGPRMLAEPDLGECAEPRSVFVVNRKVHIQRFAEHGTHRHVFSPAEPLSRQDTSFLGIHKADQADADPFDGLTAVCPSNSLIDRAISATASRGSDLLASSVACRIFPVKSLNATAYPLGLKSTPIAQALRGLM